MTEINFRSACLYSSAGIYVGAFFYECNKWLFANAVFSPCGAPLLSSPQIKQTQDEEKKQLTALRDLIKSSLQLDQKEVGRSRAHTPELSANQPQTEIHWAEQSPGVSHTEAPPPSLF